jgi:hypothetical protein
MNTHRAWRPRVDRDPLLNPFAPVTQQRSPTFDRVELAETEEEEGEGSLAPVEQQTDPSSPAKSSGPP